jgi:AcrR family transcriptional regulator
MPKAFSEDEKVRVRETLMRVGMARFQREGVRAARIDDLSRDAGIAKGSFYAFFPSKEELFMAIVEQREAMHRKDMSAFLRDATDGPAALASRLFDMVLHKIETDPVLNVVLASGEIAHLVRKLGPERFAAGQQSDEAFARQAAELWTAGGRPPISDRDLLSLLTIMLALATQRQHMTDSQYRPAVQLLRQMFVQQLAGSAQ